MGRRYRNTMVNKKETITYHVYVDNVEIGEYAGDKAKALAVAAEAQGEVVIKKTRVLEDK